MLAFVSAEGNSGNKGLLQCLEVDVPALHVGMHKFHVHSLAYIHAGKPARKPSFYRGIEQPDPGALFRGARNDPVEALADPVLQQHGACQTSGPAAPPSWPHPLSRCSAWQGGPAHRGRRADGSLLSAALSRRCVIMSGNLRFGAVECE